MFVNDSDFLIMLQVRFNRAFLYCIVVWLTCVCVLWFALDLGIAKGKWGLTSQSCSAGFSPRKKCGF